MGKISANPQLGIDKKPNGLIDLEITYGGNEAPFGGIDASAPPQYIDPNCFVDAKGFIVSSKRLVACGFFKLPVNLSDWVSLGANYIGAGTYYANSQYYNWCLGYTFSRTPGPPAFNTTTYYIYVWPAGFSGNVAHTASVPVVQYDSATSAIAAEAIIGIYGPTATDSGDIFVYINGIQIDTSIVIGNTSAVVASNMAGDIMANGTLAALLTATAVGSTVKLVANTAGAAGNNITLSINNPTNPGVQHANINQQFTGGADATSGQQFGFPILPLSWVAVGESLYFSGGGSLILQYSNTSETGPLLSVLTQYLGAITLAKYGGFLIAGGIVNSQTTNIAAPEMVIAWCANGQFGIWNPLDVNGFVTGAGFNEIADLSDYITGIFIMNSIAIILHTQGIDYLTLTGSGSQPFNFEHISISKSGEGCQSSQLNCQYDQVGFFIGNTDVFEYSSGMQSIGEKIRQLIMPSLENAVVLACTATQASIDNISTDVLALFLIDNKLYSFNGDNRTWTRFSFINTGDRLGPYDLTSFSRISHFGDFTQFPNQKLPIVVDLPVSRVPTFWELDPFIQNVDFPYITNIGGSTVTFPAEEIDFGKDITIDGLYVSAIGMPGQKITFIVRGLLNGNVVASNGILILGAEADGSTVNEYKVYFSGTTLPGPVIIGAGSFIGKTPQLIISIDSNATGVKNPFQLIKAKMFGSYDPTQKPI